jgi:cytochrome P450
VAAEPRRVLEALRVNPYPAFRALHARGAIVEVGDARYVCGHAAATTMLKDLAFELRQPFPTLFDPSTSLGALSMNFANGAEHRRRRAFLSRAFQPTVLAGYTPRMTALLEEIFRGFARRDTIDLIDDFARVFPVRVIGELLGVPRDAHAQCLEWAEALAGFTDPTLTLARADELLRAAEAFVRFVQEQMDERRARPQPDIITDLTQQLDAGGAITEGELVANIVALFLAGHETTTSLISSALEVLHRHPDARAELEARPELLSPALEEVMRYETPIQFAQRFATEDAEVEGVHFPRGAAAVVLIGAANRDPRRFAEPDRFDLHRSPNPHLAFSVGPHACLGAGLARLEGHHALSLFMARFPRWSVATAGCVRRETVALRSWKRMPVELR